jgi:hypothetical protein
MCIEPNVGVLADRLTGAIAEHQVVSMPELVAVGAW